MRCTAPTDPVERTRLEAERASTSYWREAAELHRRELDRLRRRPLVRAALAADRVVQPMRRPLRKVVDATHRGLDRGALAITGLRARSERAERLAALDRAVATLRPSPSISHDVTMIDVDRPAPRDGGAKAAGSSLLHAVRTANTELVCLHRTTVRAIDPNWVQRLCEATTQGAAVATAHVVHRYAAGWLPAPDHLLTRELGVEVHLHDGEPALVSRAGGELVQIGPPEPVPGCTATAVVVRRSDLDGIDLHDHTDIDAAMIDLCVQVRRAGGHVVAVRDALVADERRVGARHQLRGPLDTRGDAWRALVERHGAALLGPDIPDGPGLGITITTAVPSRKLVDRWGDWHLAEGLGDALRRAGHRVLLQTADEADSLAGRVRDVHLVVRGLHRVRRTPGQAHVLWIVSHPETVTVEECDDADLVCVASSRFAAELRDRTSTPVVELLQATDPLRFRPVPPVQRHRHAVTVVAKSRERLRSSVAVALEAGLRPAIHGFGWADLVDPSLVVTEHVPNHELPAVYCSAGVVLNDHWDTMRTWGFVSNRIFDVLACGAPIVSDHLPEVESMFDDAVATFRDAAELRALVDGMLADPAAARGRAARGRDLVLAAHTFDHRAAELLTHLEAEGITLRAAAGRGPAAP